MHPKRLQPRLLTNGADGYVDPDRPDRGWIRVVTELETRRMLVGIARERNVSLSTIVREALWAYLGYTTYKGEGMVRFNGQKNPERRQRVEHGQPLDDVFPLLMAEYRKTSTIYAVQMPIEFEVDTLEGLHSGKRGDWLAVGQAGELYPIDGAIFAATYQQLTRGGLELPDPSE